MKKLLIGLILVMLLIPGSCAPSAPAGPPEPPVPPTTPEPITVEPEKDSLPIDLDVSDYPEYLDLSISIESLQNQPHIDAVMNAAVGEELTVTLGSNPTTGFRWSEFAEISDETIVQQTSHTFVGPETTAPGTPGEEVWTFKALKKGTTTISMEYSRPWEEEDIGQWTVTITANIRS
ncbi:hypothetical protein ES708_19149 [subsurface metagenome]